MLYDGDDFSPIKTQLRFARPKFTTAKNKYILLAITPACYPSPLSQLTRALQSLVVLPVQFFSQLLHLIRNKNKLPSLDLTDVSIGGGSRASPGEIAAVERLSHGERRRHQARAPNNTPKTKNKGHTHDSIGDKREGHTATRKQVRGGVRENDGLRTET